MSKLKKIVRIATGVVRYGPRPLWLARTAIRQRHAIQRTWELMSLVGLVRELRPRSVLEIGTARGGTLFCWSAVAAPDARLVALNLPFSEESRAMFDRGVACVRAAAPPRQDLHYLEKDSQLPETRDEIAELLGGSVDFLFIDGDHSYEGVRRDFELYAPLVRSGGMIALHDIHPDPTHYSEVHRFWKEVRGTVRSRALIDQDHPGGRGMGIGVLFPGVQPA